jgi:predicted transcriptional regulator
MKKVTFRLDPQLAATLERLAKDREQTKADVIRAALERFAEKHLGSSRHQS